MAVDPISRPVSSLACSFTIGRKNYIVTCTGENLSWNVTRGKDKDGVTVPIPEILSVTTGAGPAEGEDQGRLTVVYVKHKKGYILRQATVAFTGSSDDCSHWCKTLQELIDMVSKRPRSALVLVNPISGRRKGLLTYQGKVAPVFHTAALKTDVIVTESEDHVKEIISTYDMASIDSVVVVGGDGMYHLVADAIIQRDMREAGLDVNDSKVDIPDLSKPIGIIPCGTGNGIARNCYGNYDFETSALAIVVGTKQKSNVFGIWSGGQFMTFSILQQGSGVFADIIYETDVRRNLGIWRYPVVIGSYFLKGSMRSMDVTVEFTTPNLPYLNSESEKSAEKDTETVDAKTKKLKEEKDVAEEEQVGSKEENPRVKEKTSKANDEMFEAADIVHKIKDSPSQPWQTFRGRCISVSVFTFDSHGYKLTKNPAYLQCSRFFIMKQWSRLKFIKYMASLITCNPSILQDENFDNWPFLEYKVRVDNPEEQNGKASWLNVDGEFFKLKAPEYHCKVFPQKICLFSSVTLDNLLNM